MKSSFFGCVHDPTIIKTSGNKSRTTERYISNIRIDNFFLQNEKRAHELCAQNIERYETRFYLFTSIQKIRMSQYHEKEYYMENAIPIQEKEQYLVKYKKTPLIYIDDFLEDMHTPLRYIRYLTEFYIYLQTSISLLVQHKLVHYNITNESIAINEITNTPTLFKFGHSIYITLFTENKKEFLEYIDTYTPKNIYKPLEIHLLSYMITNKKMSLTKENIEEVIADTIQANTYLHRDKELEQEEAMYYFKKYENKTFDFVIEDVLQYWETWDAYALSICFLDKWVKIEKQIKTPNSFVFLFIKILLDTIHSNPEKRVSLKETTNKIEELCYQTEPEVYKQLLLGLIADW